MDLYIQVEVAGHKRAAQREMEKIVKGALPSQGIRNIGFPSGNRDETIYAQADGKLWCAFGSAEDARVPRRWNAFGIYEGRRYSQTITVEINIPTDSNSASVAGFFARDPATNAVYLMHDGSVGGGKPGVSRSAFLAWSRRELVEVERSGDKSRDGIVIGRVDSRGLPERIWSFVREVRAFKDAVDKGELDSESMRRRAAEWDEYRKESAGRRRGRRRAEIDYVSYHGDVVDLLKNECERRKTSQGVVSNSPLIDLFVKTRGSITEIYEVKTSLNRQTLYTAMGQLMTHTLGAVPNVRRVLVVPEGAIPDDLSRCLDGLQIDVRRFKLTVGSERTPVLL
ncbi:hypothetical protein RFN29_24000 [Mesorhizobium sp. VK22B]|uniref:Restriction endonuclease n=1 Tax=Mesorhizobium captivum TaxID=3072319 RepID=A0ABU4Z5Y2_9HYPH|nr:hypothetical protein [Mesorhizobium sp. VK22B]MDX8494639.1 hypothetical protein [Mesorhizobium sp. VK22B]